MKKATKLKREEIIQQAIFDFKSMNKDIGCLAEFEKWIGESVKEYVISAELEGHVFSKARFDPTGSATFSIINSAYNYFISYPTRAARRTPRAKENGMIKITEGKGFGITFDNGYTVSVQFGAGNYCQNYNANYDKNVELGRNGSNDAECAVIDENGDFVQMDGWFDSVNGYMPTEKVGELMEAVRKMEPIK